MTKPTEKQLPSDQSPETPIANGKIVRDIFKSRESNLDISPSPNLRYSEWHDEAKSRLNNDSESVETSASPAPNIKAISSEKNQKNSNKRHEYINTFRQVARMALAAIYLCYIILTIPLSFEIGGLNCGLCYSLTILILYFTLTTLRIVSHNGLIWTFLYYMQHLLLPSLLSVFLTQFSGKSDDISSIASAASSNGSYLDWLWWKIIVQLWKFFLVNSTPLFTILEGFCSLLTIQAVGQVSQFLVHHRSDTWSIVNLIVSSCILLCAIFFAVKIYVSPAIDINSVGLISASLLGSAFTCTTLITIYGVSSGRASPLECVLLTGYIVKCSYELFPELSRENISSLLHFIMSEFKKIDTQANGLNFGSFAPHSAAKDILVNVVWRFVVQNFPRSFQPLWDFFKISMSNLTLPILLQLAYRICVFFAATKIISALQPVRHASTPLYSPSSTPPSHNDESKKPSDLPLAKSARLIYAYSPCIIIAVYTNLMIQYNEDLDKQNHFWHWLAGQLMRGFSSADISGNHLNPSSLAATLHTEDVHSWQFWNWVNIFSVLLLYYSELSNHDPDDSSLADHWA